MKHPLTITTAFLLIILTGLPRVSAQGGVEEWKALDQEAGKLTDVAEYDRALVIVNRALEIAEENAEPLFKRALAIREKALPANHSDIAENLAALYRATKRNDKAKELEKRAAGIRAK